MIKSEIIKIEKIENFDNLYIERKLAILGFDFVRWAVVDVDEEYLAVSISYVE